MTDSVPHLDVDSIPAPWEFVRPGLIFSREAHLEYSKGNPETEIEAGS
jgi:hypothetical protein